MSVHSSLTNKRTEKFLLIITGDGIRGFVCDFDHPSVKRIKDGLREFDRYYDAKGNHMGMRVFVAVLERWMTDEIEAVQNKDFWKNANWDGTLYDDKGEPRNEQFIDAARYVSKKEAENSWQFLSDLHEWFAPGERGNKRFACEVCVVEDCY